MYAALAYVTRHLLSSAPRLLLEGAIVQDLWKGVRSSAARITRTQLGPTTCGASVDANEILDPVLVKFVRQLILAANSEQEGTTLVIGSERFCLTGAIKDAVCVIKTDNSNEVVAFVRAAFTHRRQLHEVPKRVSTGTKGPEPGAAAEVPVDPKALDAWAAQNAIHAINWALAANSSPILRLKHPTEGLLAVVPAFTARVPIEGEQRKRAMDQHLATRQAKEPRTASTPKLRGGAAAASKPPASAAASSAGTSS